ncbi:MAG: hypothetical protein H7Y37_12895 [Anaerolineae bacterium]|nr:hypothetical protein [Gloeobacterales cyanobacterium ES-bin-313]
MTGIGPEGQEYLSLDAEGKVVVHEPKLAEISGQIADDDLEGVAGGVAPITDDNGQQCFCKPSRAEV